MAKINLSIIHSEYRRANTKSQPELQYEGKYSGVGKIRGEIFFGIFPTPL